MSFSLGIDTSNYTTSAAAASLESGKFISKKKLLPVKQGELGLRQSDAVFLHTKQFPEIISSLFEELGEKIESIGVSARPRDAEGSYMPCFFTGICNAVSISRAINIPLFEFSHQSGHIASVLFGSDRLDLVNKKFIAFHISGGTTEAVLVSPDKNKIISEKIIASSLDLKAGQAIDRVGNMLSLPFPSGRYIDELSQSGILTKKIKISSKNCDISLSGIENKCRKMLDDGESKENISLFCIESIKYSIESMLNAVLKEHGNLPIVFSGGVSSNTLIRKYFSEKYGAVFAALELSSDNAVGTAVLSQMKSG